MFLDDEPRIYTVVVASATVAIQLADRERGLTAGSREHMLRMLCGVPEAVALAGFLLEAHVYRQLKAGGTLKATRLCGEGVEDKLIVTLPPVSEECQITNKHDVSAFDVDKPQLGIPVCKNLESIDGFYWLPKDEDGHSCLLLFQVTVSLRHPVKANGCVEILKSLGMWEDVVTAQAQEKAATTEAQEKAAKAQKKPTVALVFVIPEVNSRHFGQQEVLSTRTSGKKGIVKVADGAPVVNVRGIGPNLSARLNAAKIGTVGELRNATASLEKRTRVEQDVIKAANKRLKTHESDTADENTANDDEAREVRVVQQIPQYMWAI